MIDVLPPQGIYAQIYSDTKNFFSRFERRANFYGFKILNGPPHKGIRFLFVGYQPAGRKEEWEYERKCKTHLGWPSICEYGCATWKLATVLRSMLGDQIDFQRECVGINAIFLRYSKVEEYVTEFAASDRRDIEKFCLPRVKKIVEEISPKKIIAIGFSALRLFGNTEVGIRSPVKDRKGRFRVLTLKGSIAGREAIGVLHLSGTRISSGDRKLIAKEILK